MENLNVEKLEEEQQWKNKRVRKSVGELLS